MKGKLKKIITAINLFLLGAGTKIFASEQPTVYGPAPDRNFVSNSLLNQTTVYGPPSAYTTGNTIGNTVGNTVGNTTGNVGKYITSNSNFITTMIASIALFAIGLIVLLNKNISKAVKTAVSIIVFIAIVVLISLHVMCN